MNRLLLLTMLVGCGESGQLAAMRTAFENASETVVAEQKATSQKTDEAVVILKDNTAALARIEKQLEASLVESKSVRKEDDQQSAQNPPAKANTQQTPLKVATPGDFSKVAADGTRLKWNVEGDWNPDILTTARHLREEHGIDTNGMTHQQMADLHASIHDGKPVAAKSETVRYVSRGTNCPNGQCPTSSTRYVRRSRR